MIPEKINYLDMKWELKTSMSMYQEYKDWTMYVYYPVGDKELVDVDYKDSKFNKLLDNVHIAIENVAKNPTSKKDFNDLAIAVKEDKYFPEKLPEWEQKYNK